MYDEIVEIREDGLYDLTDLDEGGYPRMIYAFQKVVEEFRTPVVIEIVNK